MLFCLHVVFVSFLFVVFFLFHFSISFRDIFELNDKINNKKSNSETRIAKSANQKWEIPFSELKIEKELGRGQFGNRVLILIFMFFHFLSSYSVCFFFFFFSKKIGVVYKGLYQNVTTVAIKQLKVESGKQWTEKQLKEFYDEMKVMQ
jgi:hypothetical protein